MTKSGHFSSSLLIVWHRPLRYGDCHRAAADCDFDCHYTTQTDSQVGERTPARVQALRETRFQILKGVSLMDSQARRCPPCGHCPGVRAEKGDTGATCSGTEDRSFYLRSQKSQPGNTETQVWKVFTTTKITKFLHKIHTFISGKVFWFHKCIFFSLNGKCLCYYRSLDLTLFFHSTWQNVSQAPSTACSSARLPSWHVPGPQSGQRIVSNRPAPWERWVHKGQWPTRIWQIGGKRVNDHGLTGGQFSAKSLIYL